MAWDCNIEAYILLSCCNFGPICKVMRRKS